MMSDSARFLSESDDCNAFTDQLNARPASARLQGRWQIHLEVLQK